MSRRNDDPNSELPFYKRWQFFIFLGFVLIVVALTLPLLLNP